MSNKDDNEFEKPSKSQRKRDMIALQKLGETLVSLSNTELDKIPLSEALSEAISEARRLKSHEAKRRQMQYIGRLMRDIDSKPIEDALANIQLKAQLGKAHFHQIERWRDKLKASGDEQLQEFLNQFPTVDHQHLRQLIRNAKQEKSGADTELFRYLRQILG